MSDAAEVVIARALFQRLAEFAAAQTPAIPVSYPSKDFNTPDPTPETQWLRATLLRANTNTLGIGYSDSLQHYGMLQVDVFRGQGQGEPAPARIAAAVVAYFTRGTRLSLDGFNVDVIKEPFLGPLVKSDPWVFIPVRIPYQCLAAPT